MAEISVGKNEVGPETVVSQYQSRTHWLWEYEKWFWDRDVVRETLLRWCGAAPGSSILDVGCGIGGFLRLVSPYVQPGGRLVGVDKNVDAVADGNAYNKTHGYAQIELEALNGEDIATRFGDGKFDIVTEQGALSSTPYPESVNKIMAASFRVLKPGGAFFVIEEDLPSLLTGLWMFPGEDEAQREWLMAIAKGALKVKGSNTRIGPEMPTLMYRYGFTGIRVLPYMAPSWFPPFEQWMIDSLVTYAESIEIPSADIDGLREFLHAAGLSDEQIAHDAEVMRKSWLARVEMMKRNEMPVENKQIYYLAVGRKPL
jgi:ubiquinone/menaquinone biosynthesis C-methylase UbiE